MGLTHKPAKRKRNPGKKKEPGTFYTAIIWAIGNSNGVILNNQLIQRAGLNAESAIIIQASDGFITIKQQMAPEVNTVLSTWDKQFKAAIKKGAKPEGDLFEGITNDFDSKDW